MLQTKYASAVPKKLGLGLNFGRAVKTISSLGVRSLCLSSISRRVQFNSKYGLVKKVSTKSAWEGSGDKNQKSEFVCFDAYRRVDWNKHCFAKF